MSAASGDDAAEAPSPGVAAGQADTPRDPRSERRWTVLLVVLALTLPVGALLQPWVFPSRSALPLVPQGLRAPTVLITVPGLRADRLGHLGYAEARTPTFDTLARQGVSFTRAYAASNDEHATLAALHGGRSPVTTEVYDARGVLPGSTYTLAERLQRYGIHTVAVHAGEALAPAGLQQGYEVVRGEPADASADDVFRAALDAFDAAPSSATLLWVDLGDLRGPFGGTGASARYDDAVTDVDAALGRFFDGLRERMVLETATVCVTGTRGTSLGEHGGDGLADLYEESVHVPLLFRLPARAVFDRRLDEFAQTVDVGPTLLKLALKSGRRSEWSDGCGRALLKTMMARNDINTLAVSQGRHAAVGGVRLARAQAVWSDRFKLIGPLSGDGPRELYDMQSDAAERTDGADTNGAVALALTAKGRKWQAGCGGE